MSNKWLRTVIGAIATTATLVSGCGAELAESETNDIGVVREALTGYTSVAASSAVSTAGEKTAAATCLAGTKALFSGWEAFLPWYVPVTVPGILNLPMLTFFYLSVALPTATILITTAVSVEMFGYGFGYVGVILLMMQEIAPGRYRTAHYAFANSIMSLGLVLRGAASGWIQTKIGYPHFFVWVIIAAAPAMALSHFMPISGTALPAKGNQDGSR